MIVINVNGKEHRVDVDPETPLLWVLRDEIGVNSVKYGCGEGMCGVCTVLINGEAERSCVLPVSAVGRGLVVTIEGLPEDHPVKQAWIEKQVPQCGYCQPGMMLQAADVLENGRAKSDRDLAEAMDDFTCRCGTHPRVLPAMKRAAEIMKKRSKT